MSNLVDLPPNNKSGLYKAPLHTEGGVQVIVDGVKKIEVEGDEYHLEKRVLYNNKEYAFKNKTNLEILDYIFKDNKSVFVQGQANSSDYIICRLAVLDKTRHDFYGTAKDFVNLIQGEHGCKTTGNNDYTYEHRLGGEISTKDFNKVTIKYKGFIPYVADSYSQKFNQKATLLRDYSDDTVVNENGKTDFKEPKYYSYGYLKAGTSLGTKRGWTLNLPKKGMSIEMQYHPQQFEEVKDLYWVFEGRVFPFPEDAKIEAKKITEKNQSFRDEYNLGNSLWGYGKKSYIAFNDSEVAAIETYYDSTIEKSNKYYAVYFGDEKNGLYEKALITHSLPNAYLYARQFDVNQAYLVTIENGKVIDSTDIYPYSESTDLQEIAKDWLNEYYGLNTNETDLEKGIKVEEEHRDTVEKLAKGEISADEGVKQIVSAHLAEDPAYYNKLETVESPFYKFIEIVDTSKDFEEAYSKAKQIKDVSSEVATAFYEKYNPEGKLSMEKSFRKFYDEHKKDDLKFKISEHEMMYKGNPNAKWVKVIYEDKDGNTFIQGAAIDAHGSKEKAIEDAKNKIRNKVKKDSEKQELQDLIDLLKDTIKENPDNQESKDLLELYEENLKELNAKFENGGLINLKLNLGEVGDISGYKSDNERLLVEKKLKWEDLNDVQKVILELESKKLYVNSLSYIEDMDVYNRLYLTSIPEEPIFKNGGELNAEESIVNAPCINKKFKFIESSDYNEYRKGGSVNGMSKAELKEFYNTKEGKELDKQTHDKWKKLVNMSKSELEKFYNSEEGKEAGLSESEAKEKGIDSGRESARWIMKMKDIPYAEWTPEMWIWAKKQISFISRMSGMKGDLYEDKGNKTRKHTALLIWGHNPEKYENGGEINSKYNSIDELINGNVEESINFIYNVLKDDGYYNEEDGSFRDIAEQTLQALSMLASHDDNNPIITKHNDKVFFKPFPETIKNNGIFIGTIKYASHFVTKKTFDEKHRTFDSSKAKSLGLLYDCIHNPDNRIAKTEKGIPKVYYTKKYLYKNKEHQTFVSVFRVQVDKDGYIQHITIMPNRSKNWGDDDSIKKNGGVIIAPPMSLPLLPNSSIKDAQVWGISSSAIEHANTDESITNLLKSIGYTMDDLKNIDLENEVVTILTDFEQENINYMDENLKGTLFASGGKIEVRKVSVYQTAFYGLSFADLGGYFESKFTDVIDLEDKNVILKDAPIFLFFKNPYDTRYSEKISIDDVIGAIIPKKMEKDARNIFDKRFISYTTYSDYANTKDKINAIKKLADINEDVILR